jgi:hypothetical protein
VLLSEITVEGDRVAPMDGQGVAMVAEDVQVVAKARRRAYTAPDPARPVLRPAARREPLDITPV